MNAMTPDSVRLHVGHFRAEYVVPAAHPNPQRVKLALDETVRDRLPDALRAALGLRLARDDGSVVLIRELHVDADVDASRGPDETARQWASTVARSLLRTISRDADAGVVRFPSRAAYLAQFLTDLCAGHAWGRWYYERYSGLRSLTVSQAVRTVLCDEPRTGLTALLSLPGAALARLAGTVTPSDARRVLDAMPPGPSGAAPSRCLDLLCTAWREAKAFRTDGEPQEALRLFVEACRRTAHGGPVLARLARALVRLERRLAERPGEPGERLLTALSNSDPTSLYALAGSDAPVLLPLQAFGADRIRDVASMLAAREAEHAETAPEAPTVRTTPFGGTYLLLPFLSAIPFGDGLPGGGAEPAGGLLRFYVLMKCLGRPRSDRVFFDPLIREAAGFDRSMMPADATRRLADLRRRRIHEALLSKIASLHRGTGAVSGTAIVFVRVARPGAPIGVVMDLERGVWLFARGFSSRRPERFVGRVRMVLAEAGLDPQTILSDPVFAETLRRAYPNVAVESPGVETNDDAVAPSGVLPPLDRIDADLRYLATPRPFSPPRDVDLALSVAAQGLMRAFAWGLPGFAGSSLPYLFDNFLDVRARLEDEPARRVVRLGRPPLQFVLGLTGMARRPYRLGWQEGPPFELYPE